MRDTLNIEKFNTGIINSVDSSDISLDAASFSCNVDGDTSEGRLTGIPKHTVESSTLGTDLNTGRFIVRDDGTQDLVYYDASANKIKAILDFYGTPSGSDLITGIAADSIISMQGKNKEYHIGMGGTSTTYPRWVGYIDSTQFGSAVSGLFAEDARLLTHASTSASNSFKLAFNGLLVWQEYTGDPTETTPAGYPFAHSRTYRYNFSVIYDGIQESPLSSDPLDITMADGLQDYASSLLVDVAYTGTVLPSKRITGINLYRCEDTVNGFTEYRLVRSINIGDSIAYNPATSHYSENGWYVDTNNTYYTILDTYTSGATYEANTGLSETITNLTLNYSLSVVVNEELVIGRCYHPDLPDASHCLFKSKTGRYEMFDWTTDILRLPFIPTALASFGGRIFAFDENQYYKINPNGFYVEEIFTGAGCLDQRGFTVTEWGMFFCNGNNVWLHDGRQPVPIGNAIRRTNYFESWITNDYTVLKPVVVYDSVKDYVLFISAKTADGITYPKVWAYSIGRKRWDYFEFKTASSTASSTSGAFTGKDGETYFATGTELWRLFNSTDEWPWYWVSGEITLNDASQYKKFYKIIPDSSMPSGATLTVSHTSDNSNWYNTTANAIGAAYRKAKKLRIKLAVTGTYSGHSFVNSIGVIVRKLIGAR